MKKLILVIVLLLTLIVSACDGTDLPSGLTLPPGITTNEEISNLFTTQVPTDESQTSLQATTQEPSTGTQTTENQTSQPTSDVITTIINKEIYLQLNAGQDTVEINDDWTDAGAKFVVDETEYDMTSSDTVDTTKINVYPITYEYDYEGKIYEITRIVVVLDQTPPVLELNLGIDTIVVGNEWIDAGVTVTDNSGEEIIAQISGSVDINTPGTYEIIYTATDSSGNSSYITRYVTIIE